MLPLARQPQRLLAPSPWLLLLSLSLLLQIAGAGSAVEESSTVAGRNSSSSGGGGVSITVRSDQPDATTATAATSTGSQSDDLGDRAVSFVAHQPTQTRPRPRTATTLAIGRDVHITGRWPFYLDFTAFRRRWARQSETSDTTKIGVSTVSSSIMNVTRRFRREGSSACFKFEEGDPIKQEFYSPGYPERYPKNLSCYKVLTADPGMVLKVEFRDSFELEDHETCAYDYLDVRDGKYGYSRNLTKFCRAFPFPEITSSSRYLWFKFHSDNSIQGTGFRAVWTMIPRPAVKTPETEECILNVTNELEFVIKSSQIANRKKIAAEQGTELDCIWNITVPENYKIQITFPIFNLDKPNECDINYVQVYDREPTMINNPTRISNFCGSIADLVTSKGNEAYLRFFVTKAAINSTFEAIMTAIREKETKDKGCEDTEFDCQDACIWGKLRCNGRPNCRYRFDEDADICDTLPTGLNMKSEHVIIILVVFSLLMSGLCFTFMYNCISKLIRDHRIIKEHIRQSRENRLDELGRKSTPMTETCTEIGGNGDDHHRHHHHLHRHGSSESPSLEVLANPKELVSPMAIIAGREYTRERSIRLSVDLSDIHQSNNVSNATQERLQESEERETRDMECQTRESLFDSGFILKPTAHPAFTTFGFQTPGSSRKQSLDYHPDHHYHHHAHPHQHPQPYLYHHHHHPMQRQGTADTSPPSEKIEQHPTIRRCSVCHPSGESHTASRLCLRHSLTPIVPAPPGWSAHESMYNPDDLANLQRLCAEASPKRLAQLQETELLRELANDHSISGSGGKPSPKFIMRQRTVGSGENYGFIYGADDKDHMTSSDSHTPSSAASSQRSGLAGAKPVKCPQVADSRFKTEAIIEVDQKRPFSIESTKSAPDVIATH